MKDREIVSKILKMVPSASFNFHNDCCVSLKLTNEDNIFFGLIRHYSPTQKNEIIRLIQNLSSLKVLDLRKNRLGKIDDLSSCPLEELDIGSNYIGELPVWLRNMPTLKTLNIGVNELKKIPDWLPDLTNIETLKMHKNHLKELPDLSTMKKISYLNLYLNQWKNFPKFIWDCDLEGFAWGISGIKEIPPQIGRWKNLKWLLFVGNKIERLPNEICSLTKLINLKLHKNHLKELPEKFGEIVELNELILHTNELEKLPESFNKLKKLKTLNLAKNKFIVAPNLKIPNYSI